MKCNISRKKHKIARKENVNYNYGSGEK